MMSTTNSRTPIDNIHSDNVHSDNGSDPHGVQEARCPPILEAHRRLLDINAVAESAFSTINNEFYHHYSFTTCQFVRRATMQYIEVFYNRWRAHTRNQGLPSATAMANYTT